MSGKSGGLRAVLAMVILASATFASPAAQAQSTEERVQSLESELAAMRAELAAMRAERESEREEAEAASAAPSAAVTAAPDEVASTRAAEVERLAELERRLEVLAGELERLDIGEAAVIADQSEHGLGPAASKIYRTERGLSLGGYGEMVYQRFDDRRDDGSASGRTDDLDFLRAILYAGYKFNDRWLLNAEFEWEHGASDKGGEIAVEFAYLDYLWRPELNVRAGMVLLPMGLINELHEPTVFPTVRRSQLESAIIPSTWRENGAGIYGDVGPWSYRTYVVNGLDGSKFTAGGLRGGRQKGAHAKAEDFAWTGRLDYTGVPGLLAGVSAYVGDSGQGLESGSRKLGVGTQVIDAHVAWGWRGLDLRLVAAQAEVDDVVALNQALGLTGTSSVGERMQGHYLEAAYDLFTLFPHGEHSLSPFVRWEELNTQDKVPAGFRANPANDQEILTVGLNWQPIDQVIFKVDWQDVDNAAGTGVDQVNLGLGYIF